MLRRMVVSVERSPIAFMMVVNLAIGFMVLVSVSRPQLATATAPDTETKQQQQQQPPPPAQQTQEQELQLHPYMPVAVKFWTRSSEFGERDNWRDKSKPCTLLERIQMNEQSVVSMGDTLDGLGGSLEANVKELVLAMDGMLLLEEDTLSDSLDPMFIQYLNRSGDCVDGEQVAAQHVASSSSSSSSSSSPPAEHLFQFQPDSDHMSWFNPLNWASQAQLESSEVADWMPDARAIPCDNDVVVFGERLANTGSTLEGDERAKVLSFKVNFRPSEAAADEFVDVKLEGIRVARLRIGNQSYNQQEFERLVGSDQYSNILFEFNSSRSLLRYSNTQQQQENVKFAYASLLTIDESSIYPDSSTEQLCMDEAGCLCNNYQANVMKAICSFNYPLEEADMLCRDPIVTAGYCNKLCATVMTISMDPTKFKERFLLRALVGFFSDDRQSGNHLGKNVYVVVHRTHDTKYQILFRYMSAIESDELLEESELRKVPQFAQKFIQQLSSAERSFYGIRSINLKSSFDWKLSTRKTVFWVSFPILFLAATLIYIFQEGFNERIDSIEDKREFFLWLNNRLSNLLRRMLHSGQSIREGTEPLTSPAVEGHLDTKENDVTTQSIPLIKLESITGIGGISNGDNDDDD